MIRRLPLWILLVSLSLPSGVHAQRQGTPDDGGTDAVVLTPEARVLLGTIEAIRDYALDPQADSALFEQAIDGLLRELGDPYATVLSPDEVRRFEEQSTGNYAGIGISISQLNGAVTITQVFPDTPAERAGLLVGDRIVGVDSDEGRGGWNVDDASSRIRGRVGTTVVVFVERDGYAERLSHEMRREQVHVPVVSAEVLFSEVGYVALDRVTRDAAAEVDSVLTTSIPGVRGLVLDLRGNPGGYLDEALRLADLFLDRGTVLAMTRSRVRGNPASSIREESHWARLVPRVPELPMIVLVDEFSASAAEIVAGALQDHDRALVIGARTFGKGTVQSVIPLPEGRVIRVTSGEWFTPQGRSLSRKRDLDGHPIEADSVVAFESISGRPLQGGGGVFPDLDIPGDTLTSAEQGLLQAAVANQVPLNLRIQEAAFATARRFQDLGQLPESYPPEELDALVSSLLDAGLPPEVLGEEAVEYLRWQVETQTYSRMGREDRYLELRSERDTALAAAIRLLGAAGTQDDLFALVETEAAATPASSAAVAPGGVPDGL
jgi:carboxyl-terminal processing protease